MCCPVLTVDAVAIDNDKILLIKRKYEPFKGKWALPGGRVECGERVEEAVLRELKEETGLDGEIVRLVGVYSDPNRDPRGHYVTVVFLVKVKGELRANTDAEEAKWFPLSEVPWDDLAFDHAKIIKDALRLVK